MKKIQIIPYLKIFAVLLLLISVPQNTTERLKGYAIAFLSPLWELENSLKNFEGEEIAKAENEFNKLKLENQILSNELNKLKALLSNEAFLIAQREKFSDEKLEKKLQQLSSIRLNDLQNLVIDQLQSLPAQIIFRSPSLWNSTLWINVGKSSNRPDKTIVAKNSPVVVGTSLLGVIDFVGDKQSRVRLITDPGLTPSVRAIRNIDGQVRYLAKGELHGCLQAENRHQPPRLKGTGFNYDYPDNNGPARDLRTGAPNGTTTEIKPIPIIEPNDLLITTGMDGVFPPGMLVAKVTHLTPLKEGDYFYEIEAIADLENLDEISMVYVLPPSGFTKGHQY